MEIVFPDWHRLWASDPKAEIFQTPEWAKAWWLSYGQQVQLCTLLVYQKEELLGILPLVKSGDILRFLGTPQADYCDIVCDESRAAEVIAAAFDGLLKYPVGWKECVLEHLPSDSRLVRFYPEMARKTRRRLHVVPTGSYQTIVLRENRDEVFKEVLGKQHTRRRQNKLAKAGRLQFRHLETRQEARECLNDFFRHHVRRRAVMGKTSACSSMDFRNFLRALVEEIDPAEQLRVGVLELDGQAFAWALGFYVNGKFLLYQHTFDVDAWDYSPGEVLLWNLLEYSRSHVRHEFDFGKGAEAYKNRFSNSARDTFSLFVEPAGPIGEARGLYRRSKSFVELAARNVKQTVHGYRPALALSRSLHARCLHLVRQARHAANRKALLKHLVDPLRKAASSQRRIDGFIWQRTQGEAKAIDLPPCRDNVCITVGKFGDLVDVVLEEGNILGLSELAGCRQRLKRGDRVYIVRQDSKVTSICWTGNNCESARWASAQADGANPPLMAVECRSTSHSDGAASYKKLLSTLMHEAATNNRDLVFYCRRDQAVLRGELHRLGFQRFEMAPNASDLVRVNQR